MTKNPSQSELLRIIREQKKEIEALKKNIDMEKKIFNQKIQDNQLYYEELIALIPGHVYWFNTENKFLGCNNQQAHSAGLLSRQDIVGKTNFDMPWREQANELNRINNLVMETGKPQIHEEYAVTSNGEGIYLSHKVPLRDKDKIIGVLGVSLDITKQKKQEKELLIAKEAAEAASKAKTEFLANMSHDIRTPLTGVIGISIALEDALENPRQKEDAHMLHDCGQELLSMLNDILDTVQAGDIDREDINEETFNLYECIDDLIKLEKPTTALKKLDLLADIEPGISPCIVSDRKKIHRILLNLISNAVKFTKTGHITIGVKCLEDKGESCHLQFSIADTGIGIPKELQDKVFERFFRVTPSYKGIYRGHGLGLNIVQSYVTLLGGQVTLTSEEGVGTTFYFDLWCKKGHAGDMQKLPVTEAIEVISESSRVPVNNSMPVSMVISELPPNIDSNAPLLLLVEDQSTALRALEAAVSKSGYRFKSAQSGEDALSLVMSNSFDLIIADVGLPGISGNEMTTLIRQWEKQHLKIPVPIVGLTGHAECEARDECLTAGMNDVFSKPASASLLQNIFTRFIVHKKTQEIKNDAMPKIKATSLGPDLPNTEKELFELNNFPLVDANYGLQQLNDLDLLRELMQEFISEKGQDDIKNMKLAYENKDWEKIEKLAHKIKGGAAYLGTRRFQFACQYLERYYKAGHREQLDKLYHQLIEINDQTITELTIWLSKYDF